MRVSVLSTLFMLLVVTAADAWSARFQFDQDNVPGWTLMTSAERAAHHQKMLGLKSEAECRAYMDEHRARMEARARERNRTLRAPHHDVCGQMKAKGLFD